VVPAVTLPPRQGDRDDRPAARPLLFSIHAWVTEAPHDAMLQASLPDWRIVSVPPEPLEPPRRPAQRLEHWVTNAASMVDQAQQTGPLHLIGWSLGGGMAYLIADELVRRGRSVAYVGIIDTSAEWPSIRPASIRRFVRILRTAPSAPARWNVLRRGPISRVRWRAFWAATILVPPSRRAAVLRANPDGEIARYLNPSILANWRLGVVMNLPSTAIPVTVFVTPTTAQTYGAHDLRWSLLVGGHFVVQPIPGTHTTVFDAEHFGALIEAIERSLPIIPVLGNGVGTAPTPTLDPPPPD